MLVGSVAALPMLAAVQAAGKGMVAWSLSELARVIVPAAGVGVVTAALPWRRSAARPGASVKATCAAGRRSAVRG